MRRPVDHEATIGRPEGGQRIVQIRRPAGIGAKPRPRRAAQRQNRHRRTFVHRHVRRIEPDTAVRVPASPAMPQPKPHAQARQPPQPRAQQWRGLHRPREYPAAGTNEGGLPKAVAPRDQRLRRKAGNDRRQPATGRAVVRQQHRQRFSVGKVQAASPGHQQLPANRWHLVVHRHRDPCPGQGFGCDKSGGATTNDRSSLRQYGASGWR